MTATTEAPAAELGRARLRKEDAKLITGQTNWTDNIKLPGMLHMAFVRSPYAHARITRVDVSGALSQPGVLHTILLSGASVALIGLLGLGLGAIIRHTAAAVTVLVSVVYAGELFLGQLNRTIDAYLPAYIVGDTLGGHTCGPGAVACPLPAWAGMSVLAAYAAAALLIGGCILAWRDA